MNGNMPDDTAVLPTAKNARRYSALLFAGIAAITLSSLIALISVKPNFYIASKGQTNESLVPTVPILIADCHFAFIGCHNDQLLLDPLNTDLDTKKQLHRLGQAYNINPQVLITLDHLNGYQEISLDRLEKIAQTISMLRSQAPDTLPQVFNHPQFGSFALKDVNQSSLIILTYLSQTKRNKPAFAAAIATPEPTTKPTGFIQTFTTLFGYDPTIAQ